MLKLTFFIAGFEFVPVEIKDENLLPKKKKKPTLKEKIRTCTITASVINNTSLFNICLGCGNALVVYIIIRTQNVYKTFMSDFYNKK